MDFAWFRMTFLRLFKFLQIKKRGPNLWAKPILQIVWIIWSRLLYFNFKTLKGPIFGSLIRTSELFGTCFCISILKGLSTQFFCNSLDFSVFSAWFRSTFLLLFKFLQIKKKWPNFWGEPFPQIIWITWSLLLYFNFKAFKGPISSSFIRFQYILYDSEELWNQFSGKSELYKPYFCNSILKDLWTQIIHSLYLHAFCLIQKKLSPTFEINANLRT